MPIVFLVLALVISNGFWIYKTVDNAVTLNHTVDSGNFTANTLEQAIRIANLNVIGMSAEVAYDLLISDINGLKPFEKEGCIYAGNICLELDANRVITGVR